MAREPAQNNVFSPFPKNCGHPCIMIAFIPTYFNLSFLFAFSDISFLIHVTGVHNTAHLRVMG
jgi:hypothetical protein